MGLSDGTQGACSRTCSSSTRAESSTTVADPWNRTLHPVLVAGSDSSTSKAIRSPSAATWSLEPHASEIDDLLVEDVSGEEQLVGVEIELVGVQGRLVGARPPAAPQ